MFGDIKLDKESNMKALKRIITMVVVIGLVIGGYFLFTYIRRTTTLNSYDVVFVSDDCNCNGRVFGFKSCKHTYGVNGNDLKSLSIELDNNRANIYKIRIVGNTQGYLKYDEWYKLCDENGHSFPSEAQINNYNSKNKYNNKDKEVFDKIVALIDRKDNAYGSYFIVGKKNYYLFDDGILYKYDKNSNSLNKYIEVDDCDLDYFYEK